MCYIGRGDDINLLIKSDACFKKKIISTLLPPIKKSQIGLYRL